MVHQVQPQRLQTRELLLAGRAEADIGMGGFQLDAPRLGRIDRGKGFGHVVHRIRIVKLPSEHDHVVSGRTFGRIAAPAGIEAPVRAADGQDGRQE